MNDLDWLARNVHEWDGRYSFLYRGSDSDHAWSQYHKIGRYNKDQWLARRAELQNKPSWSDAPEWAQYLAQDNDGAWEWFSHWPCVHTNRYLPIDLIREKRKSASNGELLGAWRDTLERRPNMHKIPHEIDTSAERVQKSAECVHIDPVNHPSHYASGEIECIEAIKASMTPEAFKGYLKGNAIKYLWRYEKKIAPAEDLKKAQWYQARLIKELES